MSSSIPASVFVLIFFASSIGFAVELENIRNGAKNDIMMGLLRAMTNQTKGDSLNLPANASSIRENITDTFSCDNRTYGYYADVDNDCQIFHVCLPSQTSSGRNYTYKWSFICPNETIFNQDVLTCTRPRDSIDCADSPMYYDRNEEIYKTNDTNTQTDNNSNSQDNKEATTTRTINKRKNQMNKRKQNLVIENSNDGTKEVFPQLVVRNEMKLNVDKNKNIEAVYMGEDLMPVEGVSQMESKDEGIKDAFSMETDDVMMNERLVGERKLRSGRKIGKRGSFRFKADA